MNWHVALGRTAYDAVLLIGSSMIGALMAIYYEATMPKVFSPFPFFMFVVFALAVFFVLLLYMRWLLYRIRLRSS